MRRTKALNRRKPLRRTPPKQKRKTRRKRWRNFGRTPAAKRYFAAHPQCELCCLLKGEAYRHFISLQPTWLFYRLDVHHVWTPTRWEEGDANFLTVCKVCHKFTHECWQRYGRLACLSAKIDNGTFDREVVTRRWKKDPIAVVAFELACGVFNAEPAAQQLAEEIVLRFQPNWSGSDDAKSKEKVCTAGSESSSSESDFARGLQSGDDREPESCDSSAPEAQP